MLQSVARFRNAKYINLSFTGKCQNGGRASPEAVLTDIYMSECSDKEYSHDELTSMLNNEEYMQVARRIAYKNKVREGFKNTVLILFEIMGYSVTKQSDSCCKQDLEAGAELIVKGEKAEKARHRSAMINAEHFSCGDEARKTRDSNESETDENFET